MTICNLTFLVREGRIILQEGRAGLQKGYLTGSGGKLEDNETPIDCSVREGYEESGVIIHARDHELRGVVVFHHQKEAPGLGRPESRISVVHVYIVSKWLNSPIETAALGPAQLFSFSAEGMPFDRMYPGTQFWFPPMFGGERFVASLHYDNKESPVAESLRLWQCRTSEELKNALTAAIEAANLPA